MTFPAPVPGLVIRYSFLWSREARTGATEGRKDRPCAIVVAIPKDEYRRHEGCRRSGNAQRSSGSNDLSTASGGSQNRFGAQSNSSWVCLDELNVFSWPGYDLRVISGTDRIDYGHLPKSLFEAIRRGVLDLHRARRTKQIVRD